MFYSLVCKNVVICLLSDGVQNRIRVQESPRQPVCRPSGVLLAGIVCRLCVCSMCALLILQAFCCYCQEDTFLVDEQIAAAKAVTFADLEQSLGSLPSAKNAVVEEQNTGDDIYLHNKMYAHGHITADSARTLFSQVKPAFKGAQASGGQAYKPSRAAFLGQAEMNLMFPPFNSADANSALVSHFQVRLFFLSSFVVDSQGIILDFRIVLFLSFNMSLYDIVLIGYR